MKRLNIYEAMEEYVNAKVALALNEYDLRFTMAQTEKRAEKLSAEVFATAQVVNRKIKRLYDQAAKARRANSREGTARKR